MGNILPERSTLGWEKIYAMVRLDSSGEQGSKEIVYHKYTHSILRLNAHYHFSMMSSLPTSNSVESMNTLGRSLGQGLANQPAVAQISCWIF